MEKVKQPYDSKPFHYAFIGLIMATLSHTLATILLADFLIIFTLLLSGALFGLVPIIYFFIPSIRSGSDYKFNIKKKH